MIATVGPIFPQNSLDSLIQSLPETCELFMEQRGFPSLSIAVVLDQNIVFSQAFGYANMEKHTPATTETIYRIGSITKVFSATMLMQLVEEGKIYLDDQLSRYIPEYRPQYPPNTGPTTLRQLVTHTSGLQVDADQHFWHYYSNFLWIVNQGRGEIIWGVPKDDLIASLDKVDIIYTPNMYPNYSNFGFQLLGMALEKISGESFEDYIQKRILLPLGMKNSGFELNEVQKQKAAIGYVYLEPNFERLLAPEWDTKILKYSGGLNSTPEDIARFITFQFRDQKDGDTSILRGDTRRLMRSPHTLRSPDSRDTYGIGWALYENQGQRVVVHAGGHWGFGAKVEFLPDLKLGVVIMTNCNYPLGSLGPDKDLTKIIYEKFIPILKQQDTKKIIDSENIELEKYVGNYSVPGGYAKVRIHASNDTLIFSLRGKLEADDAILPTGLHQFCYAEDPGKNTMFRFQTDEENNIVGLEYLSYRFVKEEKYDVVK
jgi:CubicO group peptidase (beta-lactamase class C family)